MVNLLKVIRNRIGQGYDVKLTITERCNAKCQSCFTWKILLPRNMSFATFKSILDEAVWNSDYINHFHYYSIGESLLHPEIQTFINYANLLEEVGVNTVLTTNASVDGFADFDFRPLGLLVISFNGLTRKSYEENTGLSWSKTIQNIRAYLKGNKRAKKTEIHVLNFKGDEVIDFDLELLFNDFDGLVRVSGKVDNQLGTLYKDDGERVACDYVTRQLVFAPNGDCLLCSHDFFCSHVYGNISKLTFKDLWKAKENDIKLHKSCSFDKFEDLCKECNYNIKGGLGKVVSLQEWKKKKKNNKKKQKE